jgi:hypothetical protein
MLKIFHFLLGAGAGILLSAACLAITAKIVYDQKSPEIATNEETLIEDYAGAKLSATAKTNVSVDLRYVLIDDSAKATFKGYGSAEGVIGESELTVVGKLNPSDASEIRRHSNGGSDISKNLSDNCGAIGILLIAKSMSQNGFSFESLTLGDCGIPL